MKPANPKQKCKVRTMLWTKTTSRIIIGTLLGAFTIGISTNQAAALTPLDLIKLPLNAVNGESPKPLPNRNIDVFKENVNGNNLNVCVSPAPCSVPTPPPGVVPSQPIPSPQGSVRQAPTRQSIPPSPQGSVRQAPTRQSISPSPQGSVRQSSTTQPQTKPSQGSPGPVLTIPPIKLF